MSKKNLLSGREKELQDMAEQYEQAQAEQRSIYLDAEDLADLADWYGIRQKQDMALEVVDYGLRLHPDNTSLLIEKAYLYLDEYDTETAREIAGELDGNQWEVKVLQAQICIMNNEEAQANRLLADIEDPQDIDVMINVGYMYINVNHPDKALEWLTPGIGKYEDDEPFLSVLGDAYYGLGRLDEAAEIYNKLIDKNPYSATYWFVLARCYFDQQMYDKAIEACDYAIISDDEFAEAYQMRGNAYIFLQNEERALEDFREAARLGVLSQCFIDTYMGLTLISQERCAEAFPHLQKAIDNYADDNVVSLSTLYANAAYCLEETGQKAQAAGYWKEAHQIGPKDAEVYLLESKIHVREGNYDLALHCWQQALTYAPTAITWHEIGVTCMEYGAIEYARSALERAKQLEPNFYEIDEKLATVYLLLKDKENFQKYNRLCKHPLTDQEMENMLELLKNEDKETLMQAMRDILDALK